MHCEVAPVSQGLAQAFRVLPPLSSMEREPSELYQVRVRGLLLVQNVLL